MTQRSSGPVLRFSASFGYSFSNEPRGRDDGEDGKEDISLRKHLAKQRECFEKGALLMSHLIDRDIPTHVKRSAGRQVAGRAISTIMNRGPD